MKILLKNCISYCFLGNDEFTGAVHISILDDKISDIQKDPVDEIGFDRVIDCCFSDVLPGGIDPHVHLSYVQGNKAVSADSFRSGSLAALAGGTTSLMDFVEPRDGDTAAKAI